LKFSELAIHPDIIKACAEAGFETLTEIQEKCLIPATEGKDIAGISQTGTGKTVAFLLPMLDRILRDNLEGPAALIITPTRELCLQIAEEAQKLTRHSPVSVCAVYGGEGYKKQEEELARGPQIIAATPGRLIDYIKQGKIDLNKLHFLVLDEADRMFDMGFIRDIRYIMKKVPREAQTMLFSATLSYYVMRLASDFMQDPVEVRIESETVAVDKIEQQLVHLGKEEKMPYLINQVLAVPDIRGIVFTNLKVFVPTIVNQLRRFGIHATGLSSMLDQKKRVRLLKDFKLGKYSILVATDVASRGLDVDDISHVFNYDLPQDAESYVHRIGRTARAGKTGVSISYCSEMDYENLPRIEAYLTKTIPVVPVDPALLKFPVGDFKPFVDEHAQGEERPEGRRDGGRGDGRDRGRGRGRGRDGRDGRGGGRGRDFREPRGPVPGPPREFEIVEKPNRESANEVRNADRHALLTGAGRQENLPGRNRDDRDRAKRDNRDGRDRDRNRGDRPPGDRPPREGRDGQGRHQGGQGRDGNRGRGRRGGRGGQRRDGRDGRRRDRGGSRERSAQPVKKPGILSRILSIFKKKKD
jgi:ATP-dependent RNA helicase RhlB